MKKIGIVGSMNMDFVLEVDNMPQVGETVLARKFDLIPGGKGANQAYAVGKLSGNVAMLGAVGDDEYGRMLCGNLKAVGVDVSRIKVTPGVNTGTAFISVNAHGDNSIIVAQGANRCVDTAYIDENMDLLGNCDIVVFQLEIPLQTVVYAAKKLKALGKTIVLDPAPARRDIPQELYACVDIIKPNEVELGELLGDETARQCLEQAAERLKEKGVQNVVVTLGGEGAFLSGKNVRPLHCKSEKVKVVDTTAAGDSFTGAMALALSKGDSIESALEFAIRVAGIVVTRKGAQTSVPTLEELLT